MSNNKPFLIAQFFHQYVTMWYFKIYGAPLLFHKFTWHCIRSLLRSVLCKKVLNFPPFTLPSSPLPSLSLFLLLQTPTFFSQGLSFSSYHQWRKFIKLLTYSTKLSTQMAKLFTTPQSNWIVSPSPPISLSLSSPLPPVFHFTCYQLYSPHPFNQLNFLYCDSEFLILNLILRRRRWKSRSKSSCCYISQELDETECVWGRSFCSIQ